MACKLAEAGSNCSNDGMGIVVVCMRLGADISDCAGDAFISIALARIKTGRTIGHHRTTVDVIKMP